MGRPDHNRLPRIATIDNVGTNISIHTHASLYLFASIFLRRPVLYAGFDNLAVNLITRPGQRSKLWKGQSRRGSSMPLAGNVCNASSRLLQ